MTDLDLISFLKARLDEDEKIAMEAADEGMGVILGRVWAAALDAKAMTQQPDAQQNRYLAEQGNAISHAARMLALGDPERALREITAKRKLMDRFRRAVLLRKHSGGKNVVEKHYSVLGSTLETLAAVYSGHQDYRAKWLEE